MSHSYVQDLHGGKVTNILGAGEAFLRLQTEGFCHTILLSGGLSGQDADLLGFEKAIDFDNAMRRALARAGESATVGIIPQAVKIDRSLISGIGANQKDEAIMISAIALLRSLRIKTVAIGVETEKQVRFLLDEGCTAAQGVYFYEPMTAADMEKLLRNGRSDRDLPRPVKKAERETTSDFAINCYLETKGIKHALVGYRYLLTAIRLGIDDRTQLARINDLYCRIAQMYQTEPNNVERGIRHSIIKYGLPNKEFIVKAVDDLVCGTTVGILTRNR